MKPGPSHEKMSKSKSQKLYVSGLSLFQNAYLEKIIQSTFENALLEKIIWAHANQEFGDGFKCFQRFKCLLGQKNYFKFFRSNFIKNRLEIKNVQTFNIEKQLIHNFVNGYKRFQACQMFTGIKKGSRGFVPKYRLPPLYVMVVNVF